MSAPTFTIVVDDSAIARLNWFRCAVLEAGEAALKLDADRATKAGELLFEIRSRLGELLKFTPLNRESGATFRAGELRLSLEIGEPLLELLLALRTLNGNGEG